ncbi:hypothetical protein ECP029943810_1411 [Escherichia coli P0299438.10]|uniref:Uncharacterized protein n=1 Tax=Escherichia coli O25b:H4 TaxID=941280 RepID=A0A192C8D6_ECO25|nr:hypothetical protein WLH_00791 [Escherichia coli O25b:H4]EHW41788.1 hypothetical protein ECDEC9A_1152 [Escherichia coli DEC9A]EHW49399.1 hypothetical protein ECDEC9C_1327 [Escherichia coli DEC9C]EHW62603.1 hypothetical protein ECDEC9E_0953 [Escherichia coli DEC9E]EHW92736.1 hypothetical protein ECDEC11A_1795 [Escherichia coli DEC11A]EHW94569.1 hypothetical protein ECDEC10F_3138 [Escherichia coli DEC10F]ENA22292.1 hypothetical protein EC2016001_2269 [Escherichia coli 201600.1]ENB89066.1 hy
MTEKDIPHDGWITVSITIHFIYFPCLCLAGDVLKSINDIFELNHRAELFF